MSVTDYKVKAIRLLEDRNTYEKVDNPPTIAQYQSTFSKKVKDIIKHIPGDMKKIIQDKVNNKLPTFPYFYGSPKIHKEGVPLRPIIATCGSPQSKLAKWLADNLSKLLGKKLQKFCLVVSISNQETLTALYRGRAMVRMKNLMNNHFCKSLENFVNLTSILRPRDFYV